MKEKGRLHNILSRRRKRRRRRKFLRPKEDKDDVETGCCLNLQGDFTLSTELSLLSTYANAVEDGRRKHFNVKVGLFNT